MKCIVWLLITLLCSSAHSEISQNKDLDQFPFDESTPYNSKSNFVEDLTSGSLAFGMNLINYDVEKTILAKVDEAFTPYQGLFPPGSIPQNLHASIVKKGIAKTLGDNISDKSLSDLIGYVGSNLLRYYANASLVSTSPVTDPIRRGLWIDKLLAPFEKCTAASSNFRYQTTHCLRALLENSARNIPAFALFEGTRTASKILPLSENARTELSLSAIENQRKCQAQGKTIYDCIQLTFNSFSLEIYQRKLNEIMVIFAVPEQRKNKLMSDHWVKSKSCILGIPTGAGMDIYRSSSVQCLASLTSTLKNEIAVTLSEQNLSKDHDLLEEVKLQKMTNFVSKFTDCFDQSNSFLIRTDGFSFLMSTLEVMKKCDLAIFNALTTDGQHN